MHMRSGLTPVSESYIATCSLLYTYITDCCLFLVYLCDILPVLVILLICTYYRGLGFFYNIMDVRIGKLKCIEQKLVTSWDHCSSS